MAEAIVGAGHGLAGVLAMLARRPGLLPHDRLPLRDARRSGRERSRYGHGRHTLWTGDLGTALYVSQCLDDGSALPAIELW